MSNVRHKGLLGSKRVWLPTSIPEPPHLISTHTVNNVRENYSYPDHASTLQILEGSHNRSHQTIVSAVIPADAVVTMADLARTVHVDPTINDYVARLIEGTRTATEVRLGVSVRGALALIRVAKTFAAASGRHYVVPDDVKTLADPVLAHRILIDAEAEYDGVTASSIIGHVLLTTPPPTERATV